MATHFVGIKDWREKLSAIRTWGKPDFVHAWHDWRMYGDIGPDDCVILGSRAGLTPCRFSWQDCEEN